MSSTLKHRTSIEPSSISIETSTQPDDAAWRTCRAFVEQAGPMAFRCDPRWLAAVCGGLGYEPYLLLARRDGRPVGMVPLAFVESRLFGRFLVSLPYLNSAGVIAEDETVTRALVDRAVELADRLDVRYLELRQETAIAHPALTEQLISKVHMRLALPDTVEAMWDGLKAKVRNKVRKGQRQDFTVHWGTQDLLGDYYDVFSRNMRDLGTPVFGRPFFKAILSKLDGHAELCVVRDAARPIAAALLVHGPGVTEVPSASSLREYNSRNANDLMYWALLQRAVERGQSLFDFGRSTLDGNTYVFKKKWGALPEPVKWRYYVRKGSMKDMRIESGKYDLMIRVWRRLPLGLTRLIGPRIIRGIPS